MENHEMILELRNDMKAHGELSIRIVGKFVIAIRLCNGHWNGYVGVTQSHPLYGKPYSEVEDAFKVHGGLTYAGTLENLCEGYWFFGFDTAHFGDASGRVCFSTPRNDEVFRDWNYVSSECESLLKQLKKFKS